MVPLLFLSPSEISVFSNTWQVARPQEKVIKKKYGGLVPRKLPLISKVWKSYSSICSCRRDIMIVMFATSESLTEARDWDRRRKVIRERRLTGKGEKKIR